MQVRSESRMDYTDYTEAVSDVTSLAILKG